jgi:hypothetical protein
VDILSNVARGRYRSHIVCYTEYTERLAGIGSTKSDREKRGPTVSGASITIKRDGSAHAYRHVATMGDCVLTALVLVCSVLVTPDLRDCDEVNARVVMLVPAEFASPITCAMHGQAYLAETAIGRSLAQSDRIKVVCRPRQPSEPPLAERDGDQIDQARGHRVLE